MTIFTRKAISVLILFVFIFSFSPLSVFSAPFNVTPSPSKDERQVEDSRDKAIHDALVSIDPSLATEGVIQGEVSVDESKVAQEVESMREARKSQFKNLAWSHVKHSINRKSVIAKNNFLTSREKNLEIVVDRAVDVYVPAEVAKERMTLAKFRIVKAVRELFPAYTVTGNIKQGVLSRDSFLGDSWRMQFRQPVFRGGVLWNTLMLELSNLDVAKSEYAKAISDLVADVSEAYFEFERTRNAYQEEQRLFEIAKGQKEISDKKYEAKITSEIEKLNTDSLYSQAQYDMETAQQELEVARLELQKYLKLDAGDEIEVKSLYSMEHFNLDDLKKSTGLPKIDATKPEQTGLDQLIDMAYQYRPDLQVEAFKLKASQLAYRVALGKRLPQVDVLLEFGELAEAFNEDLSDASDPNVSHDKWPKLHREFRAGLEVTWPVAGSTLKYTYDNDQRAPSATQFQTQAGSRTRSNAFSAGFLDDLGQFSSIIEAKISNLEQVVELEKTERDVIRDVKEAYFNYNKALIQVESAYKRMGYRDRLAQLAKHRLETNEIQTSEYLQAEMDLSQERALVYKALADFFLSKAKLNRSIGIQDYLMVE